VLLMLVNFVQCPCKMVSMLKLEVELSLLSTGKVCFIS
jgi:hypothetical protein